MIKNLNQAIIQILKILTFQNLENLLMTMKKENLQSKEQQEDLKARFKISN